MIRFSVLGFKIIAEFVSVMRLIAGNVAVIILMFIVAVYYYSILPERIPTHFGLGGKPDRYGSKDELFLISFLFSTAQILILTVYKFRFKIWRYLNLPIDLKRLDEEKRRIAIDRYFELLLKFFLALGFCLLVLEICVFECMKTGRMSWWFYLSLFPILVLVFPFMVAYYRLEEELKSI